MKQCDVILALVSISLVNSVPQSQHVEHHSIVSISDNPVSIVVVQTNEPANTNNFGQANRPPATERNDTDVTGRDCIHTIERYTTDTTFAESVSEIKNKIKHSVSQRQPKSDLPKVSSTIIETKYSENWHGLKEEKSQHSVPNKNNSVKNVLLNDASVSKTTSCNFWDVFWVKVPEPEQSEKEYFSSSVILEKSKLPKAEEQPVLNKGPEAEKEVSRQEMKTLPNLKNLTEIKYRPAIVTDLEAEKGSRYVKLLNVPRQEVEMPPTMKKLQNTQRQPKFERYRFSKTKPNALRHPEIQKNRYAYRRTGKSDVDRLQKAYRQEVKPYLEVERLLGVIGFPVQSVRYIKTLLEEKMKKLPNVRKLTEVKYRLTTIAIYLESEKGSRSARLLNVPRQKAEMPPIMYVLPNIQKHPQFYQDSLSEMERPLSNELSLPEFEKHLHVKRRQGKLDVLRLHKPYRLQEGLSEVTKFLKIQNAEDIQTLPEVERRLCHLLIICLDLIIA